MNARFAAGFIAFNIFQCNLMPTKNRKRKLFHRLKKDELVRIEIMYEHVNSNVHMKDNNGMKSKYTFDDNKFNQSEEKTFANASNTIHYECCT